MPSTDHAKIKKHWRTCSKRSRVKKKAAMTALQEALLAVFSECSSSTDTSTSTDPDDSLQEETHGTEVSEPASSADLPSTSAAAGDVPAPPVQGGQEQEQEQEQGPPPPRESWPDSSVESDSDNETPASDASNGPALADEGEHDDSPAGSSGEDPESEDDEDGPQLQMQQLFSNLHARLTKKHNVSLAACQTLQDWLSDNIGKVNDLRAQGANLPRCAGHLRKQRLSTIPTVRSKVYIKTPGVNDRGALVQREELYGEFLSVPLPVLGLERTRIVSYVSIEDLKKFAMAIHEGGNEQAIEWNRIDFSVDGVPYANSSSSHFYVSCLIWPGCDYPFVYQVQEVEYKWSPNADGKLQDLPDELRRLGMTVRYFRGDCIERHTMLNLVRL